MSKFDFTLFNLYSGSNIELESDEHLEKWIKEILALNSDRITLPNVPYNLYEMQRELTRRDNIRDL